MVFLFLEVMTMGVFSYLCLKFFHPLEKQFFNLKITAHDKLKKTTLQHLNSHLTHTGHGKIQIETWWNHHWKSLMFVMTISLLLVLLTRKLQLLLLPCAFCGFKYYFLIKKAQTRKFLILKRIPFLLDILILNLESGLDFISSLEELVKTNDSHPLLDEIRITLQGIKFGETRSKSFENLAVRTGVPELSQLASSIQQSDSMGSSLTELLRLQSNEIRYRIFKQAEREAQKAPVKILIPMMLFIFPVVFVILFIPIGIQLFTTFK